MTASVPTHAIPLRFVQAISLDIERVCPLFSRYEADWLGTPIAPGRPDSRRYVTDLSMPVRERAPHMTFKKAAYVDLGDVRPVEGGCEVDISWRSSTMAPLFPVFAGHLTVTSTELRLEGYYAPPGGEMGMVLDRAFLNIAARSTARWFLGRVAAALGPGDGDSEQASA